MNVEFTSTNNTEESEKIESCEVLIDNKNFQGPSSPEESQESNTGQTSSSEEDCSKLQKGDQFFGTIITSVLESFSNNKGKIIHKNIRRKITDTFTVMYNKYNNYGTDMVVKDSKGDEYKTSSIKTKQGNLQNELERRKKEEKELERLIEEEERQKKEKEEFKKKAITFDKLEPNLKLETLIEIGMKNIWMVGPAGSGKSTMVRIASNKLDMPYLCISCGIGTSAAEFVGYKYPTREATKFSEYYAKRCVILIDEITALDSAVAQVLNAALANDEIETTTGLVHRHPECIIIATSNTFGTGSNRQYVANNQLDASTIDRFVGSIIEVNYSKDFESQYDSDVIDYVEDLRKCIKQNEMRRVASTRMIQAGTKLKNNFIREWKDILIKNWTSSEKELLKEYIRVKQTEITAKNNKPKVIDKNNKPNPTQQSFIQSLGLMEQMVSGNRITYNSSYGHGLTESSTITPNIILPNTCSN